MNRFSVTLSLTIQILLKQTSCEITEMLEDNLFRDINENLMNTVNKVFACLKLDKHFKQQYSNKLLINMQANMKTIAEKHYKIYKEIQEAAKFNGDVPKPALFDLKKPLETMQNVYLSGNKLAHHVNQTFSNLNISSLEIPDNSEKAYIFLKQYLEDNYTDVLAKTDGNYTKHLYKNGPKKRYRRKNLKAWRASNSTEMDARRVYHGKKVRIKRYPFVASIHVLGEFVCTGSIISREMVITAATCVQVAYENPDYIKKSPWDIALRVGSDYTDRSGEWVYAVGVSFHPEFEKTTLRNNLALVHMKTPLNLRKKNRKIRRIEYQTSNGHSHQPLDLNEVVLVGFGDKDVETSEEMIQLTFEKLKMYDLNECANVYSRTYVTDKNFCAGYVKKSSGACQRDVGGPAIVNSLLIGVVSFGPPICGTSNAPTVFTRVSDYVKWIHEIVKQKPLTEDVTTLPYYEEDMVKTTLQENQLSGHYSINKNVDKFNPDMLSIPPQNPLINPLRQQAPRLRPFTPKYLEPMPSRLPKAIQFLSNFIRQIMQPDYYGDDEFYDTSPDSHLWSPTTVDPKHHPLLNQSLFLVDAVLTEDPLTMMTTTIVIANETTGKRRRTRNRNRSTTESLNHKMKTLKAYDLPPLPQLRDVNKNKVNQYSSDYDDYGSLYEEGLSIEVPSPQIGKPYDNIQLDLNNFGITTTNIPPITPPRMITQYSSNKILSFPGNAINFNNFEEKAESFLKKNFKKDENLISPDASDDFVLLLLKQSTTKKYNKKIIDVSFENSQKHNRFTKSFSKENEKFINYGNTKDVIINKNQQIGVRPKKTSKKLRHKSSEPSRFYNKVKSTVGLNSVSKERDDVPFDHYSRELQNYRAENKNQTTFYVNLGPIVTNITILKTNTSQPSTSTATSSTPATTTTANSISNYTDYDMLDFDKELNRVFDKDNFENSDTRELIEVDELSLPNGMNDDSRAFIENNLKPAKNIIEDTHVLSIELRNYSNLVYSELFPDKEEEYQMQKLEAQNRTNVTDEGHDQQPRSFLEYIDTA